MRARIRSVNWIIVCLDTGVGLSAGQKAVQEVFVRMLHVLCVDEALAILMSIQMFMIDIITRKI